MITLRHIALAGVLIAALGCSDKAPSTGNTGLGGNTGTGGSGAATTIKLEVWMDGIAKNGEADVTSMPDNVLFTVTDKHPVSAAEAATAPADPGKVTIIYDEDPAALRPLLEADPRFEAP